MTDWKGDHEFPPEIAMQVTHGVPPYLLDFESRTLVAFSATNGAVNDHLAQMLSRARSENEADKSRESSQPYAAKGSSIECVQVNEEPRLDCYTEVFTRHLSHYAQRIMSRDIIPSDEMFQSEARSMLFDSEDPWNQTMADNQVWLAQFRKEGNERGLPGFS
ncbi:hypothetical protein PENSTE_c046G05098 [Penicillium steckii]|uniref:Uncharacterized protein n=1 Tax=Penicillium steckii TaxID=303698 RepID=A0A1V6SJI7_9EURO|nr:hypothetical protein PENSTE_c046G05098 [Penicillium steckii]